MGRSKVCPACKGRVVTFPVGRPAKNKPHPQDGLRRIGRHYVQGQLCPGQGTVYPTKLGVA